MAPGQSWTREDSFLTLEDWGFEGQERWRLGKPSRPQSRHVVDYGRFFLITAPFELITRIIHNHTIPPFQLSVRSKRTLAPRVPVAALQQQIPPVSPHPSGTQSRHKKRLLHCRPVGICHITHTGVCTDIAEQKHAGKKGLSG